MLLDKTLIRVATDEYARGETAPSASPPLRERHFEIKGAKLLFSFRRKSGVDHTVSITDRRLARIVQQCTDLPGRSCSSTSTPPASARPYRRTTCERLSSRDHRKGHHGEGLQGPGRNDARARELFLLGTGEDHARKPSAT